MALLMGPYVGGLRHVDGLELNWRYLEMRENITITEADAKTRVHRSVS